jgi:hypothetical protein
MRTRTASLAAPSGPLVRGEDAGVSVGSRLAEPAEDARAAALGEASDDGGGEPMTPFLSVLPEMRIAATTPSTRATAAAVPKRTPLLEPLRGLSAMPDLLRPCGRRPLQRIDVSLRVLVSPAMCHHRGR